MRFDDKAIIARYQRPTHRALFEVGDVEASGNNPFCGDSLSIRLALRPAGASVSAEPAGAGRAVGAGSDAGAGASPDVDGGAVVERATFDGHACSLCTATADLLMEHIEGTPLDRIAKMSFDEVCALWGGLEVGRARRGCVELPLQVLQRLCGQVLSRGE